MENKLMPADFKTENVQELVKRYRQKGWKETIMAANDKQGFYKLKQELERTHREYADFELTDGRILFLVAPEKS